MPRKINHNQRRDELAAAVWSLARAHGFAALTVRRVGEEAGWTSGVVQHYFPTKVALLKYAFELVQRRTVTRIVAIADGAEGADVLRETMLTLLPLDDDVRAESEVWFGFLGLALGEPELREVAEHGHLEILELMTDRVCRAQKAGAVGADHDPEAAALELLALADGLNVRALFRRDEIRPHELRAAMDARLAALS